MRLDFLMLYLITTYNVVLRLQLLIYRIERQPLGRWGCAAFLYAASKM